MNIKYLFVVSLTLFFLLPKSNFAQTTSLDITTLEPYANEEASSSAGDDEPDQPINVRPTQNVTPMREIFTDEFKYRWYIQAGGGAQLLMAEDDDKNTFMNRITVAPSLTVGYRWNPIFGLRLNFTGGSLHGYNDGHSGTYRFWKGKSDEFKQEFVQANGLEAFGIDNITRWDPQWNYRGWQYGQWNGDHNNPNQIQYDRSTTPNGYNWAPGVPKSANVNGGNFYMQHVRYVAAHAAITMNLFNLIWGADDSRKFDASIHLGPTFFHVFPHMGVPAYNGFGLNGGVQGQYHINDKFGVFAEFNGAMLPDGFDGHYGDATFDLVGQTLLGVSYKFPMDKWATPVTRGSVKIDDEMDDELRRIRAELMKEMNMMEDLRPEIERLRNQLAALKFEEKTEVVTPLPESFFYPNPVHFQIGKSDIDAEGWRVIEEISAYLNDHPSALVIVTGYADKDTGTDSINERLSRERSKKVADALQYRFHIDRDRVAIDWRGDSVQPFFQNQMNRAVLFYIEFE